MLFVILPIVVERLLSVFKPTFCIPLFFVFNEACHEALFSILVPDCANAVHLVALVINAELWLPRRIPFGGGALAKSMPINRGGFPAAILIPLKCFTMWLFVAQLDCESFVSIWKPFRLNPV